MLSRVTEKGVTCAVTCYGVQSHVTEKCERCHMLRSDVTCYGVLSRVTEKGVTRYGVLSHVTVCCDV